MAWGSKYLRSRREVLATRAGLRIESRQVQAKAWYTLHVLIAGDLDFAKLCFIFAKKFIPEVPWHFIPIPYGNVTYHYSFA